MPRLAPVRPISAPELACRWRLELEDHLIDAAFSPDGRWLAVALVGGPVALLDAASGERLHLLPGHSGGTFAISWRADSRVLASGGQDGCLRLWDAGEGRELAACRAGSAWVECVRFASSGDRVVSSAGRKLKLWNSSGALLQEYPDHPSTISDVQWQPGEPYFTSSCYGQVATWKPDSADALKMFQWKGSILRLAWSPDANYIATGNQDASVHFWYRKSGRDLEMTGYALKVRELAWDAGSRFLATGGSSVVIVWDCSGKGPAGTKPIQLEAHELPVSALKFQRQGALLASGGRDGAVCLWNPKKSERVVRQAVMPGEVTCLDWSKDDRTLVAASSEGHLRVFETGS